MTNHDLYKITRSWVGHIATDPLVRAEMNTVLKLTKGRNAAMARLINKTVGPVKRVKATDVQVIIDTAATMFKGNRLPAASTSDFGILGQAGGGGGKPFEDK